MGKSLLTDFVAGLILMVSLIGFHALTSGIFTPVLDFYMYLPRFFEILKENFIGTVFSMVILFVHLLLALGCFFLRANLNEQTNIVDVFIISIVPGTLLLGFGILENLYKATSGTSIQGLGRSIFFWDYLLSYSANTLVLFIGVLTGWFMSKTL